MRKLPYVASAILAASGCSVVVSDASPRRASAQSVTWGASVGVEAEDVNYVVYRDYFGCTDDEFAAVPYYRTYYGVDDCDLFFLFYVSRFAGVGFDLVFHDYYYSCGRDYGRLVTRYRVDPARFFVPVPASYALAGPYSRPYSYYQTGQVGTASFSNDEYRALVALKIGVDYQGRPADQVMAGVRDTPRAPHRVVYQFRDDAGKGGRTATGAPLRAASPRPWTLSSQDRETFHSQQEARISQREPVFRGAHKDVAERMPRPAERAGRDPAEERRQAREAQDRQRVQDELGRRRAAEEQSRLRAQEEQARQQARDEQNRRLAREEQDRKQAREEQNRRQAQEEQNRRLAREEQDRKQAREEQNRRQAQEEQNRRLAREEQDRKQAREEQNRRQAQEEQNRRQAREEQERRQAQERERPRSREEERRPARSEEPPSKEGRGRRPNREEGNRKPPPESSDSRR